MTNEEMLGALKDAGAILDGHFVLTSGRHSDTYIQCARVLEDPALTTRLAEEVVARLGGQDVDLVVAPAVGGIIFGFAVARALGVPFVFSEREGGRMTLRRGFQIPADARVLIAEDVVTTGGSVAEVVDIVRDCGAEVASVVSIIDRGGAKAFSDELQALLVLETVSWGAEECVLCADGMPTSSPGSRRL